jgi:hypothetical protein
MRIAQLAVPGLQTCRARVTASEEDGEAATTS